METSLSLATESFSCSWLSNIKPSFDGPDKSFRVSVDGSDEAIYTELDHHMPKSKKYSEEAQNFDFCVPVSQPPNALAHADELFLNGVIKPTSANQSKIETSGSSKVIQAMTVSSFPQRNIAPAIGIHCCFFRRWRRSSEHMLLKCFGVTRPPSCSLKGSRKNSRINDDIDRRPWEIQGWSSSSQESTPQRLTYLTGDQCDVESSIYEAVLYCKRSVGK